MVEIITVDEVGIRQSWMFVFRYIFDIVLHCRTKDIVVDVRPAYKLVVVQQ